MNPFTYLRATTKDDAIHSLSTATNAKFIGGGTNLLDLMKESIEKPSSLIDINRIDFKTIRAMDGGGLSIGGGVTNATAAYDLEIQNLYPLLAETILAGASPQLRNMATCGGNLLQRTRCYYFYDKATACNKREPGAGCDAIQGLNRIHAVFGTSDSCIATHPSDMCVALAALEARIRVAGPAGERVIVMRDFHRLPENKPDLDTTLAKDELIIAIELTGETFTENFSYLKVRDRSSYAFALVSAAVAFNLQNGKIKSPRIAMGGVAHKPWREAEAEAILEGAEPSREVFQKFATRFFRDAKTFEHNAFKVEMGKRVLVRALEEAWTKPPRQEVH